MESSDQRSQAVTGVRGGQGRQRAAEPAASAELGRLIADRTLAVVGAEPAPRQRRLHLLLLGLSLLALLCGGAWVALRGKATTTSPSPEAAAVGSRAAGSAALNLNTWPSANVYLDGRRLNEGTPLANLPISSGAHTLTLVSKDGTLRKELTLSLQAGEVRTLVINLDK